MPITLLTVAYLVAAILFILSLRGLSSQETARRGNLYGIVGMGVAVGATMTTPLLGAEGYLVGALVAGGAVGFVLAARVAMTQMPELVALLHSFVGLAAVLVGYAVQLREHGGTIARVEVFIDVLIGAITLTGSILAFLKLRGSVSGSPLLLPARHLLNLGMLTACAVLGVLYALDRSGDPAGRSLHLLIGATAVAAVLGVHLVAAIGGADMPVVVSMLNSYSGWTASAAGFMLDNDLLIVTGALVGSSGAILSYIMCRAMNRSIWNVIFGGFGTGDGKAGGGGPAGSDADVKDIDAATVAERLLAARNVIIVPGYGMAVSRAQHAVHELAEILRGHKINVRFAIHPVAGRLPGHMNVLLAEANVPYDIVLEMEDINDDFPQTDVVIVIGANDIVNPAAQTDESSPIYGMPVLEVWKAKLAVVMKRGRATGYAGVDNPLFYHPATRMLFGDARDSMEKIVTSLRTR
jgi:NAD(P) transhydrogenase subunit beta